MRTYLALADIQLRKHSAVVKRVGHIVFYREAELSNTQMSCRDIFCSK